MKHVLQDLMPTLACMYIGILCIILQAKLEIKSCRTCFICVYGYLAAVVLVVSKYVLWPILTAWCVAAI